MEQEPQPLLFWTSGSAPTVLKSQKERTDANLCPLPSCHQCWGWQLQMGLSSRPPPQSLCSPHCLCCLSSWIEPEEPPSDIHTGGGGASSEARCPNGPREHGTFPPHQPRCSDLSPRQSRLKVSEFDAHRFRFKLTSLFSSFVLQNWSPFTYTQKGKGEGVCWLTWDVSVTRGQRSRLSHPRYPPHRNQHLRTDGSSPYSAPRTELYLPVNTTHRLLAAKTATANTLHTPNTSRCFSLYAAAQQTGALGRSANGCC